MGWLLHTDTLLSVIQSVRQPAQPVRRSTSQLPSAGNCRFRQCNDRLHLLNNTAITGYSPVHVHVCYIQNNVFDFWSWIIWFGVKPSIETPCAFINYGHDMQCEFSELTFFSLNALIHANTWTTDHVSCKWGFTRGKQMCIIKVGTDASANRTTSGLIYIM